MSIHKVMQKPSLESADRSGVLFITRRFYPPWSDGIASYTKGLIRSTMDSGKKNKVTVLSSVEDEWVSRSKDSDKMEHERLLEKLSEPIFLIEDNKLQYLRFLRIINARKKPHAFSTVNIVYPGPVVDLVSLFARIEKSTSVLKYVLTPSNNASNANPLYYRFMSKINSLYKRRFILCFSSEYVLDSYSIPRDDHLNHVIVPPAVDTAMFKAGKADRNEITGILAGSREQQPRVRSELAQRDHIITYIGPLTYDRFPYDVVAKALYLLARVRRQNVQLVVVGRNDPSFDEASTIRNLRDYTGKLGVEDRVTIALNTLSEDEKVKLLNCSDVVIQPFLKHRVRTVAIDPPLMVLEAMACGKPVIAAPLFSIPEIITHGKNGYLLDPLTPENLESLIVEAISGNGNVSRPARETIMQRFSTEKVRDLLSNSMYKLTEQ